MPGIKNILIADDHAIVRLGLEYVLSKECPECKIDQVTNSIELIEKIKLSDYNLVICDINMPGKSGIDVLPDIHRIAPNLPVLLMSMYPEEQFGLRAIKAGAAGYISKDSIHDNIIEAINAVLNGQRFFSPEIEIKYIQSAPKGKGIFLHELLSEREFYVFKEIAAGEAITDIAIKLSLSATTVSTYRSRILDKLSLRSNAEIARYAVEHQLV